MRGESVSGFPPETGSVGRRESGSRVDPDKDSLESRPRDSSNPFRRCLRVLARGQGSGQTAPVMTSTAVNRPDPAAIDPQLENLITQICSRAREASLTLATASAQAKNRALERLAQLIEANQAPLLEANQKDLDAGAAAGLSEALLDRLKFTDKRIAGMVEGCRQVAALPDPVSEEIERTTRPNGLDIRKVRVPIGVVGIIYESRPNVTVDCAALCLKSGNAAILRGGKEAFHSNTALAALVRQAIDESGLPVDAVQLIPTTDRLALNVLLQQDATVNCIIPRGGEGLIRFVAQNALMPVIKHYTGVCNLFIDRAANPDQAESIAVNAKTQRPGVCNAIENLLIHADVAGTLLPRIGQALREKGVELRADTRAHSILEKAGIEVTTAAEEDFRAEFLDLILAVKVVPSVDEAIAFINHYGSAHSDGIVTADEAVAETFLSGVDSATVYWNASTRFTDGFEFGLGAEIGISTDKLHARGPMGLRELCTYKYRIYGNGQVK